MLRKFFDLQYQMTEKGGRLEKFRPLVVSLDTFFYEPKLDATKAPFIRDAVDLKRWMFTVVFALMPCFLMAIWNTGVQKFVYASGDFTLMDEYLTSLGSLKNYFIFCFKEGRAWSILWYGAMAFLPVMLISYMVGGLVEMIFAVWKGHELAEGFLVTGMLYPLVLPPTIPYWMVAVGVAVGIFLAKEVFGGTGMNIMNPALACRAFLFFTFPQKMTGDVWVGTNPTIVRESLNQMNQMKGVEGIDGYSQATKLMQLNVSPDIKKIHIDAIAIQELGSQVPSYPLIEQQFDQWKHTLTEPAQLGALTAEQMQSFVTAPLQEGGLALPPTNFEEAFHLSDLSYGLGPLNSDWGFFLGNKLGCMGETSTLAALIGAFIIIWTGVGSWRTMVAVGLGAYLTALCFNLGAFFMGKDGGAWNPAAFSFPAYKHLLLGGLAFGLVFMATDPVSSPTNNLAKWFYGLFVGMVTILIRLINPAYPEGVMLAILMGNVFAPLFDTYAARFARRKFRVRTS